MQNSLKNRLYVFFLASFLIIYPFKKANAVFPLIAAAIAYVETAAAAITTADLATLLFGSTVALTVGNELKSIALTDPNAQQNAQNSMNLRIALSQNPVDALPVNPNLPISTPHVLTPNAVYKCPSNVPTQTLGCGGASSSYTQSTYYASSSATTCTATVTNLTACSDSYYGPYASSVGVPNIINNIPKDYVCNTPYYTGSYYGSGCQPAAQLPPVCGAGYTNVNGACSLTAPEAIPDKNVDFKNVTNPDGSHSLKPVSTDADVNTVIQCPPDCAANPNPYNADDAYYQHLHDVVNSPDFIYLKGKTEATPNQPAQDVHMAISRNDSGSTSNCPYQVCIANPNVPGTYRISGTTTGTSTQPATVKYVDVNSQTGAVVGTGSQTLNGTILTQGQTYVNSAGVASTVQTGQFVLAVPTGNTYTQVATNTAATTNIDTSNLARTGEAAAAANTIVQSQSASDAFVPAALTNIENTIDGQKDILENIPNAQVPDVDFSWLPSLMPNAYVACVPVSFAFNPTEGAAAGMGGIATLDICDKLELGRQLFGYFLMLATAFLLFRMFFTSNFNGRSSI